MTTAQAVTERPKMRMLTLRMTQYGDLVDRTAVLTTATPGLYLSRTRDECDCDVCTGYAPGTPCPTTFSWHVISEAGILVLNWVSKDLAREAADRLGSTGMDFTLDRDALLAQTGSPSWKLAARLIEEIRYREWDRPARDGGQADG